ncbi:unnamed protein product [Ceutorhynchus assimilis]|uniref:Uncharacterized protein n=1 Tax=Ceutorhynchus assimilis TaxID=467358 RepID=A0A9N9MFT2_9CUCU|nr:unnamed protein product [Ceutorhynchus assimilis]
MAETNKMRNHINMLDFVILQLFFAFQSVYKSFTSILRWDFWRKQPSPSIAESPDAGNNEKRHFIQLYKTGVGEKSVCYMNVIEFDNSKQVEEIRRRKRSYEVFQNDCRRHHRTHSDNDIQRFYCSNFRFLTKTCVPIELRIIP